MNSIGIRSRRIAAALAILLTWLAALTGGARPRQWAPTDHPPPVSATVDADQERKWLLAVRQEERLQRMEQQREADQERMEHGTQANTVSRGHRESRQSQSAQMIADLVPDQYQSLVIQVADQFGLDPRLLAAVGTVESQWNPRNVGTHGDTGLMQILPSTAEWIASQLGWREYDLFDPRTNLVMGAWYLQSLYRQYGDWYKALAAYNGGPAAAAAGRQNPYAQRVMSLHARKGER